jgi:hypothetical protein
MCIEGSGCNVFFYIRWLVACCDSDDGGWLAGCIEAGIL